MMRSKHEDMKNWLVISFLLQLLLQDLKFFVFLSKGGFDCKYSNLFLNDNCKYKKNIVFSLYRFTALPTIIQDIALRVLGIATFPLSFCRSYFLLTASALEARTKYYPFSNLLFFRVSQGLANCCNGVSSVYIVLVNVLFISIFQSLG